MSNELQATVYQSGNTVALSCKFEMELDGQPIMIDPAIIKINIYNKKYELLETISMEQITREDVGDYSYQYTLPLEQTFILYEWIGEHNGEVVTKRNLIRTTFVS